MWETVLDLLPDQFLVAFFLGNSLALVTELQEYAPDLSVVTLFAS